MTEVGSTQRLAAILAADAVGYSRLMEADEHATLAALEPAREMFRTAVEAGHGQVINMAGDSVLAVFDSAAGAVTAALAAQQAIEQAAASVDPDQRLRYRIGVHLGDVTYGPTGDAHGDGVNIAARLQALAEPGGIVVSEAVRGAVKNRVPASFADLGTQRVKNIVEPLRAFAVRAQDTRVPSHPPRRALARKAWFGAAVAGLALLIGAIAWLRPWAAWVPSQERSTVGVMPVVAPPAGKQSIAVLPFDNMSPNAEQAYFADGIAEDLITDLSKVSGLFVIARNSTFAYKGKSRDIREIGKALGVRYVLEGSVRRVGDTVRVNAQLIDASTGGHVWADRYDGDMKSIFSVQDTIARNVAKALSVELTNDESANVANRGTANVQAYDVFLRGWQHYQRQTPEEFAAAVDDFKRAAEIDPGYTRAYAALAAVHWDAYTRFWGTPGVAAANTRDGALAHGWQDARYDAEQYLAKAMKEPTALAHEVASAMLVYSGQHDEAIAEARRAVDSDPSDAEGHIALARALSFAGRPAEALQAVDRAMLLNPHYPSSYLYQRGLAQFALDRLPDSQESLQRAITQNPDDYWAQRLLLAVYGLVNRPGDAAKLVETIRDNDRRGRSSSYDPLTVRAVAYWFPFAKPADAKRFATGLARAGVPE
jgi:TolB-like protein/Tfp pilus assembly protein PilF